MSEVVDTLRKIYESHKEIKAENNSFDRFKAHREREAHALARARLAEISLSDARKSMSREKLVSEIGTLIGMQALAGEKWKSNPTLVKELSMWGQSIIRGTYLKNIDALLTSDDTTAALKFPALPDGAVLPETQLQPAATTPGTPPPGASLPGASRGRVPKALFITIPLGLIVALTLAVGSNGHHTAIPLWQRVVFGVLIAALGSRRLRVRAFMLLIVAAVIAWILGG